MKITFELLRVDASTEETLKSTSACIEKVRMEKFVKRYRTNLAKKRANSVYVKSVTSNSLIERAIIISIEPQTSINISDVKK
ncbi:hypothetical protein MADA3029_270051 [Vibrio nigripulchritudo MADA3029]|nr:hypothetical protein VIBNIMADA3020_420051 [Vibrio nigripulchritudo MADA3020]CCN58814.1 hypothetical protein MADA3029_270051 [Vibrio nigripulchritudo MADA3029]